MTTPNDNLVSELRREVKRLQKFKDYVHLRLDQAGIPADPPSVHRGAGCRVGGRLDIALGTSPAEVRKP